MGHCLRITWIKLKFLMKIITILIAAIKMWFFIQWFFKHNIFWLIIALYFGMQDDQLHYVLSSWLLDRCTYGFFSLCVIYLFLFIYFPWKCILVVNIYILCININYKNYIFLQSWKLKMLQVTTKKKVSKCLQLFSVHVRESTL